MGKTEVKSRTIVVKTFRAKCLMLLLIFSAIETNAEKAHRDYPSIFQAWNGIENRSDEDERHRLARHDLAFAHPYTLLKISWNISQAQPYSGIATGLNPDQLNIACQRKQQLLSLNPNLLLLVEIRYRDAKYLSQENEAHVENWWDVGFYPPDSPYWLGEGYSLDQIQQAEDTLLWAEQHLREPRINSLEGWRVVVDYTGDLNTRVAERNSEKNLQWMRMITTLSLTHSDGYVLFGDDNAISTPDHLHNWYDFWDVDLGQPIQEKAVQYQGVVGLFVRAFEKGWAVYNRSGSEQTVTFETLAIGINRGERQLHHKVPDFDGEIFLKTDTSK